MSQQRCRGADGSSRARAKGGAPRGGAGRGKGEERQVGRAVRCGFCSPCNGITASAGGARGRTRGRGGGRGGGGGVSVDEGRVADLASSPVRRRWSPSKVRGAGKGMAQQSLSGGRVFPQKHSFLAGRYANDYF